MQKNIIYISGDHAGFEMKTRLIKYLESSGYKVKDFGALEFDLNDDYPDFVIPMAQAVVQNKKALGIAVCGSGDGACIVANKVKGVRAALAWNVSTAHSSRWHNNANILCLPGGKTVDAKTHGATLSFKQITNIINTWLTTPFSKAPRHIRRLKKIEKIEQNW